MLVWLLIALASAPALASEPPLPEAAFVGGQFPLSEATRARFTRVMPGDALPLPALQLDPIWESPAPEALSTGRAHVPGGLAVLAGVVMIGSSYVWYRAADGASTLSWAGMRGANTAGWALLVGGGVTYWRAQHVEQTASGAGFGLVVGGEF